MKKDVLIAIIVVKQQIGRYKSSIPQEAADFNWIGLYMFTLKM